MTKITQDQGAAGLTAADTDGENTLALQVVRVLGLMELRADEEGVPTLSQAAQTSRLRLEIDKWGYYETEYADLVDKGYSPPEVVFQALWNGEEIGEPVTKTMVKDPAGLFPLVLEMPQFLLQAEGVARVSYRRWIKYIDNKSTADPQLIRIDRTAPNFQNPCPLLGPDKNVAVIDQAYLDLNDQRAIFFLDRWTDVRLDDEVLLFLVPVDEVGSPSEPIAIQKVDVANKMLDPFPASIPAERLKNGFYRLFCRLKDRTGNIGPPSILLPVKVSLGGGIQLPPPSVPLAADGLVDLEDARQPVKVRIPFIEAALPGDVLQAYWNGHALQPVTVGENQAWPIDVPVSWLVITQDGFVGPVQRRVYYTGIRSGAPLDSPYVDVWLDLRVAGPDPIGPAPENPRLKRVVIKGVGGDNQLGLGDVDLPVTVEVPLYEMPHAGEILELYWGALGRVVATYMVKSGDVAGQVVRFTPVDYEVVRQGGFGSVPVFYTTFNGVNRQRAPITPVDVIDGSLGTFEELVADPPHVSLWGWINCESILVKKTSVKQPDKYRDALLFHVPGGQANLALNDRIELSWQMCRSLNGQTPISPVYFFPPFDVDKPEYLINGIDLRMDRIQSLIVDELRKPIEGVPPTLLEGSVWVGYRVRKPDGRWGESLSSCYGVSLVRGGGTMCVVN